MNKIFSKLLALHASNRSVARGFACGAAISVTPFIGFHTLLAALSAALIHANIPAALIGTIFGNPWTFAFIWPITFETGRLILHTPHRENLDFGAIFDNLKSAFLKHDLSLALDDIKEVIVPMAVGSIIFYIAVFALSDILITRALNRFRGNSQS